MTTRNFTRRFLHPLFPMVVQSLSMVADDDLLNTGSVNFGISITLRLPGLRLPGESATRALDSALSRFATLSDPLFIQDRRFIQSYGWWYFFRIPQLALATSCRTGLSARRIRSYLHRWALWWVRTSQSWQYQELLGWFLHVCWDYSPAAYAAGLLQHAIERPYYDLLPNLSAVGSPANA